MSDQTIEQRLEALLSVVAEAHRPCKWCAKPLYFVRHRNGKLTPYTAQGVNHFLDCPHTTETQKSRCERAG
jgi:hypothetical protein